MPTDEIMFKFYKLCTICIVVFPLFVGAANLHQSHDISRRSLLHVETNSLNWPGTDELSNSPIIVRLLARETTEENCTSRSINEFPNDLFTKTQRKHGALLFHALFAVYCFTLTAFVCNDYLLPAMDCICTDLKISADVAGATFLATASCFPELFVNVVGTFLTQSDLGVGTVVGSAVFNIFAIPACGALSTVQGVKLDWTVLARDSLLYTVALAALIISMWDGYITSYEAVSLTTLLLAYYGFLFFNKIIYRFFSKTLSCSSTGSELMDEKSPDSPTNDLPVGTYKPFYHGELVLEYRKSFRKSHKKDPSNMEANTVIPEEPPIEEYVEPDTPFNWPKGRTLEKVWFFYTWPLRLILFITIPDTRYKKMRNCYPLTFIICVIWIAISSYLVSWMITVIGDTLGIADSIMGITFLAAGGNMPEFISIIILAKQGNGDMAMSNSFGSNSLDILLCLGLPWTLKTLIFSTNVEIVSHALVYSVIGIIICIIALFIVSAMTKFWINKKVGLACLLMYAIYLVLAILVESNVFFFVNWPMCDD
ncbi:sodium/potassium/calcium exchanger 4 [Cephus cinctus]|uniref:Sodium/potassium/calcium exchanger 4 n=1 Tax=Cephus cinctus TaxID=211228 RepID=A0AAJ7FPE4_CEPCN|nr:sodium/potassium/calcium exchanger 4 [Cephus cinctus]